MENNVKIEKTIMILKMTMESYQAELDKLMQALEEEMSKTIPMDIERLYNFKNHTNTVNDLILRIEKHKFLLDSDKTILNMLTKE